MAILRSVVGHLCSWGFGFTVLLGLAPSASPNSNLTLVVQPVVAGSATVTTAFLNNEELFAQTIFSQIGLTVDFLSTISASSAPTVYDGSTADEEGFYFGDSSFQSPPILTVWFVNTITNQGVSDRGLSQQDGTELGSWIATTGSAAAVNDTLGHEIANDLTDLQGEITTSPNNLLEVGTDRNIPTFTSQVSPGSNYDQITSAQESFMLGSTEFVQSSVPEPGAFVLSVLGILTIAVGRRSQARRRFRD